MLQIHQSYDNILSCNILLLEYCKYCLPLADFVTFQSRDFHERGKMHQDDVKKKLDEREHTAGRTCETGRFWLVCCITKRQKRYCSNWKMPFV